MRRINHSKPCGTPTTGAKLALIHDPKTPVDSQFAGSISCGSPIRGGGGWTPYERPLCYIDVSCFCRAGVRNGSCRKPVERADELHAFARGAIWRSAMGAAACTCGCVFHFVRNCSDAAKIKPMLRVVVSEIPRGARFKRFWLPSLDYICDFFLSLRAAAGVKQTADLERVAELIRHVRVGGTNKSSAAGRLREADTALLSHLTDLSAPQLTFLDIGCSDGTASIETIQLIEQSLNIRVSAYLQDRYIWVRRNRRFNVVEYVGSEGDLLMVRCGAMALAPAPKAFWLSGPTNRLISAYLRFAPFRRRMHEISRFPLLSPHVMQHPDLHIHEGSVLAPNEEFLGRMDVVRVSNLLHFDYFSEGELRAALSNVVRYIREGGLLLVSRNHQIGSGEVERGTLWRLIASRLVPVAEFGGGSDIKGIVATM